jgi:hypothetical protein
MLDRGERLRQFRFTGPVLTAAVLASAMRFLMVMLILAGLVWCVAKYWPLKFPARQPSPPGRQGIGSTHVGTVGNSLETETGGEI